MKNNRAIPKKNELIDMLTRYYVHIIRSDNVIKKNEIDILYPLLLNLFKDLSISWEVYVKQIMHEDYDIDNVSDYLQNNLNQFDKVRLLLTLIIMAFSNDAFEMYEVSSIQRMCKFFNIEQSGFMELMRNLEINSTAPARITDISSVFQFENSLFSDYLVVGKSDKCNMKFKDPSIATIEYVQFEINNQLFIVTGAKPTFKLNGNESRANHIYWLPQGCSVKIGDVTYSESRIRVLQQNVSSTDVIDFMKPNYDFSIKSDGNRLSVIVRRGYLYKNGKAISYHKHVTVLWDDNLRIKGYAPFSPIDVIDERERIGIDDVIPEIIYFNAVNNFFTLSKKENKNTLAQLENRKNEYYFVPTKKGTEFLLNNKPIDVNVPIKLNEDIITVLLRDNLKKKLDKSEQIPNRIGKNIKERVKQQLRNSRRFNFRINNFFDLVEVPFEVNNLEVTSLRHYYDDNEIGLDNISFNAKKGELIGILGPSGCGKSTLLKAIVTDFKPTYGKIEVDGKGVYKNRSELMQYFGYVPQDDMVFPNLTVFENMYFYGRLRLPNVPQNQLILKIDNILNQVILAHKRNSLVGDEKRRILSGGQRKRLNIALELLFEPNVLICDEPTSGLSSFDAEQIIELLHEQSRQNRVVIITVHQPNAYVFKKFSKVLLMDNGGKQVYFGNPNQAFEYFQDELDMIKVRKNILLSKFAEGNPDFFYDMILFPEYDTKGKIKFEQVNHQVVTKRKFSPAYWRDKYKRKILFQLINKEDSDDSADANKIKSKRKLSAYARTVQLVTYFHRNLVNKLRNRTNLMITFFEAPLLAIVVAFILRLAPTSAVYSFFENTNVSLYLFVSIIIFMFFGMTNSINEVLDERKFILREKIRNLKTRHYIISKFVVLSIFTFIQAILYCGISALILNMNGYFILNTIYMSLAGFIGLSLGLLFSTM
ncbi:MAG: hypothetical protein B6226_04720, partial [Candidatus Cloacimonetes bacterium 4572_65]